MKIAARSKITAATREFNTDVFTEGGTDPVVLFVVYGGLTNRSLSQAYTRQVNARAARRAGGVTPESINADSIDDAKLYAAYVVKGWRNATEPDGTPAAATQDKYREFLLEVVIPERPETIPALRAYINNPDNFLADIGDPAVLGK